jgi:glycosyltransferase involved in cell wall biosynthesis
LLKEIKVANAAEYKVDVVLFEFDNWSKQLNDLLIAQIEGVTFHVIPSGRKPLLPWLKSTFYNVVSNHLLKLLPDNKWLLSVYADKRSALLLNKLKEIGVKADLVIGHNIGTFYPAYAFAKENNVPFGIDLEDYHAGETKDRIKSDRVKKLCKSILPSAAYLSAASPLILRYSINDIGRYNNESVVVNNVFPVEEFIIPETKREDLLKIVWFSQNINKDRGLEYIVPVIEALDGKAELHLYGNLNNDFYDQYLKNRKSIKIHKPLPQDQLHKALAKYDIGLAIEPDKDVNNSIAISNKINAYMQAGLFVVASNTKAQSLWINEMRDFGCIVDLKNRDEMTNLLTNCFNDLFQIRANAINRYRQGQNFSWENESKKLLQLWQKVV